MWGILASTIGAVLFVAELSRVVALEVPAGGAPDLAGLVLTAALALGGHSLVIVLLHALIAGRWPTSRRPVQDPPIRLRGGHTLHTIWVGGVAGSLALMGVLGLWSFADGRPSGLEPGWPLLLSGIALGALGLGAGRWTDQRWDRIEHLAAQDRRAGLGHDHCEGGEDGTGGGVTPASSD